MEHPSNPAFQEEDVRLTYYYYSLGNLEAAEKAYRLLEEKDYTGFLTMVLSVDNGVRYDLPEEAFVDNDGAEEGETRDITDKFYFDRIVYFEYEHG